MSRQAMTKGINLSEGIASLFLDIDPECSLKAVRCFNVIYKNEGMTLSDLSSVTGIPQSSLTNIIGDMSDKKRSGKGTAYNLIEKRQAPWDKRNSQLYLTEKGHKLVKTIAKIVSKKTNIK